MNPTFELDVFETPLVLPSTPTLFYSKLESRQSTKSLIEPSAGIWSQEAHSWPDLNYICKTKYKTLENR